MLIPETLESGDIDPLSTRKFSDNQATVVPVYTDEKDLVIVTWNLMPGQENESHAHPNGAHTFFLQTARNRSLNGDQCISAGQQLR